MQYLDFHRFIVSAILAMARIGGAFAICPALTESMIPGVARRAAIFGFALFIIPSVYNSMPPGEPNLWMMSLMGIKEAFIGFLLGFFAAVPFWIAENVGNFIDNQRGATMGDAGHLLHADCLFHLLHRWRHLHLPWCNLQELPAVARLQRVGLLRE